MCPYQSLLKVYLAERIAEAPGTPRKVTATFSSSRLQEEHAAREEGSFHKSAEPGSRACPSCQVAAVKDLSEPSPTTVSC